MIWVYGHLPIHFTELKSLDLTHNGVGIGTVSIVSAADELEFRDAVVALDTALKGATANDLRASWWPAFGEVVIESLSAKTWEIADWPARGFFGFPEYPISNTGQSTGTRMAGAAEMTGMWLEAVEGAQVRDERSDYEEGYAASEGNMVTLAGLVEWDKVPNDWTAYKGHVLVDGGGVGAWTIANPDGELDGTLVEVSARGKRSVLGQSYLQVALKVAVSV